MRGYSILIILQELMHRTFVETHGRAPSRHELPKPCDHFDLIVGTGVGGLIALMLGRLRLDIETSKDLYVRMTRRVFETDKTIAGIPYCSTMFKASRLEDAIKQCVREIAVRNEQSGSARTSVDESPGCDGIAPRSPLFDKSSQRTFEYSHPAAGIGLIKISAQIPSRLVGTDLFSKLKHDQGNAGLYDLQPVRTKTAVVAFYKGSPAGSPPVLLRSYDSRRESSFDSDCKIWQAGRATCAVAHAFKSIQIGDSCFQDDSLAAFNPAVEALDEAVVNEWPGRRLGIMVSLGAGKKLPDGLRRTPSWQDGLPGELAEARRKIITKVELCEYTHQYMEEEYLVKRGVDPSNYFRLNAELSLGDELGISELNQLSEVNMDTRRYLAREREQNFVRRIAHTLSSRDFAKGTTVAEIPETCELDASSPSQPLAVHELPGDMPRRLSELEANPSHPTFTTPTFKQAVPNHVAPQCMHKIPRKPPASPARIPPPSPKRIPPPPPKTIPPSALTRKELSVHAISVTEKTLRLQQPLARPPCGSFTERREAHHKMGHGYRPAPSPLRTIEPNRFEARPPPPPPK
ncbi:hypothetical protein HIM_05375 [Hirsutella minnesotensis 3608]|uniref:PNPLA domain-containing protein n=1 Tax=Hirsutella minnesotensis 3608 TaxID=1043627 RepID=A0A0F7ZKF0_9HYPO|nr:hypothetical protein HIM_05375 [Hirsutella minnesotensis 3608]